RLDGPHALIEAALLREISQARQRRARPGRPEESDRPSVRLQEAQDHPHGAGLAGAVGAEEAQYLAGPHSKAQIVDGLEIAVGFGWGWTGTGRQGMSQFWR